MWGRKREYLYYLIQGGLTHNSYHEDHTDDEGYVHWIHDPGIRLLLSSEDSNSYVQAIQKSSSEIINHSLLQPLSLLAPQTILVSIINRYIYQRLASLLRI